MSFIGKFDAVFSCKTKQKDEQKMTKMTTIEERNFQTMSAFPIMPVIITKTKPWHTQKEADRAMLRSIVRDCNPMHPFSNCTTARDLNCPQKTLESNKRILCSQSNRQTVTPCRKNERLALVGRTGKRSPNGLPEKGLCSR